MMTSTQGRLPLGLSFETGKDHTEPSPGAQSATPDATLRPPVAETNPRETNH